MLTLYGLKTCDTCRKAMAGLRAAGLDPVLVDLRADPVPEAVLRGWIESLGPGLLNRSSTTWRGLTAAEQAGSPLALLTAHPSLIKRPVIVSEQAVTIGWSADTVSRHAAR